MAGLAGRKWWMGAVGTCGTWQAQAGRVSCVEEGCRGAYTCGLHLVQQPALKHAPVALAAWYVERRGGHMHPALDRQHSVHGAAGRACPSHPASVPPQPCSPMQPRLHAAHHGSCAWRAFRLGLHAGSGQRQHGARRRTARTARAVMLVWVCMVWDVQGRRPAWACG